MAQDMAHRRRKFAGRALLTSKERSTGKGVASFPWYAGANWLKIKEAIAGRVSRQVARAQDRRVAREKIEKRRLQMLNG